MFWDIPSHQGQSTSNTKVAKGFNVFCETRYGVSCGTVHFSHPRDYPSFEEEEPTVFFWYRVPLLYTEQKDVCLCVCVSERLREE